MSYPFGYGYGAARQRPAAGWARSGIYLADGAYPALIADFAHDRYFLSGRQVPRSSVLTLTRSTAGFYWDASGTLQTAAANTLRFDWATGAKRAMIRPQETGLFGYDANPRAWGTTGSPTRTDYAGTYGLLALGTRIASGGAVSDRALTSAFTAAAGSPIGFSVAVMPGTAGTARLTYRSPGNGAANTTADYTFATRTFATVSTAAGTISVASSVVLASGIHLLSFVVVPSAADTGATFGIGPGSATVGQDVILLGATGVNRSYAPQLKANTGSTPVASDADVCRLAGAAAALLAASAVSVAMHGYGFAPGPAAGVDSGMLLGAAASSTRRVIGTNVAQTKLTVGTTNSIDIATVTFPLAAFGVAAGWDASGKSGSLNGGAIVTSGTAMDADFSAAYLGSSVNGGTGASRVWLSDLIVWPKRLANATLVTKAAA